MKKGEEEVLTVPEIHLDYCFIRDAAGEDYSVVLVGKDRETKLNCRMWCRAKGGGYRVGQ